MALRTQDSIQIEQLKRNKDAQELTAMAQMTDEQRNNYLRQRDVVKQLQKCNAVMVGWCFLCTILVFTSFVFPPLLIAVIFIIVAIVRTYKNKYKPLRIEQKKFYEIK